MKWLWRLFDGLDAIELIFYGSLAAAMFVGGPIWLVACCVAKQRYLPVVVLGLLWCVCIAIGVRDLRRKRFSWLTGGLFAGWFVMTVWISLG
ncbi:hypothetical protein [Prosthecobacter sp.]|uniref:hypothetical protein n=1 Tax=Prosthecobacter sp. TaxID=1965333 RepID=UPI0037835B33